MYTERRENQNQNQNLSVVTRVLFSVTFRLVAWSKSVDSLV